MYSLGPYPKELWPGDFYFHWHAKNKIQCICKRFWKGVNGDHKYLRCTYILYNNFDILCSSIALDKVDLVCIETDKAKPTENDSGFITYSNTVYFSAIWLDKNGYLITQWGKMWKTGCLMAKNWEEQKVLKVGKIGAKYEILTVQ